MRLIACSILMVSLLVESCVAVAADDSAAEGTDLLALLESVSHRLNKRFILDPRVAGRAHVVNVDPDEITYEELQAILSVHGFVATQESHGVVRVVPDANAGQLPMPVVGAEPSGAGREEVITKVIDISPLAATQLLPVLRPLLPQYAHVAATAEPNILVLAARKNDIEKIEALIADLRVRPASR
jgi:general secretion pathway protein D